MVILFTNAAKGRVAQMHHVIFARYELVAIVTTLLKHHGHLVAFTISGHKRVYPFGIKTLSTIPELLYMFATSSGL